MYIQKKQVLCEAEVVQHIIQCWVASWILGPTKLFSVTKNELYAEKPQCNS